MPKAKLSQIATTWVDDNQNLNNNESAQEEDSSSKNPKNTVKKKQTFNLQVMTINRLWAHRVRTGNNISKIIS